MVRFLLCFRLGLLGAGSVSFPRRGSIYISFIGYSSMAIVLCVCVAHRVCLCGTPPVSL